MKYAVFTTMLKKSSKKIFLSSITWLSHSQLQAIIEGTASVTPLLITVLSDNIWAGQQEPCSKVGSLSQAEHLVRFESKDLLANSLHTKSLNDTVFLIKTKAV